MRPCARCVRLGLTDSCVDAPRKTRKKSIMMKRSPYERNPEEMADSAAAAALMAHHQPMINYQGAPTCIFLSCY
jgi:hypothetical protein